MTNHPNRSKMTGSEALRRAIRAVYKAVEDSENFDHGNLASHEVIDVIKDALRAEFDATPAREG